MGINYISKMKPGDIDVYNYGDSKLKVAVEYTEPSKIQKKSNFYFAFDNPKLSMIKNGQWEFANYPHCPIKFSQSDIIFNFFILFEEDVLQCEVVQKDSALFLFIHRKTTELKDTESDLIYCQEYNPRPNFRRNILKPTMNVEKRVCQLIRDDKVFYQDNQIGEIVRNYFQWCGKI